MFLQACTSHADHIVHRTRIEPLHTSSPCPKCRQSCQLLASLDLSQMLCIAQQPSRRLSAHAAWRCRLGLTSSFRQYQSFHEVSEAAQKGSDSDLLGACNIILEHGPATARALVRAIYDARVGRLEEFYQSLVWWC